MSTPRFRSFSPALQRFFVATTVNAIGSASLFGFVLIYFHEVRGLPLQRAGFAVGAMSFTMVVCTPFAGSVSDRFGARRTLAVGCGLSVVAGTAYAFAATFPAALAVSILMGIANALWFPAQSALLALIVDPTQRPAVSAFQRASMNLGAALGGAVGGFLVRSSSLTSFRWLFAVNVATYLVFLTVLPGMPSGKVPAHERTRALAAAADAGAAPRPVGFGDVLRDGFFVRLLATDLSIALGFGFLFAFMPAYASGIGVDKAVIGVLFMLGAVSVVATQIPTLRWVRGKHRMHALSLMNLWFVAAFALMTTTSHTSLAVAVVVIGLGQVLGGFGEAILGAVRHPLTSDLAPPELVGRYFGLSTMVFQACMGLASTLGGAVMSRSVDAVWFLPLGVSCAGVVATFALRHRIPANLALSA